MDGARIQIMCLCGPHPQSGQFHPDTAVPPQQQSELVLVLFMLTDAQELLLITLKHTFSEIQTNRNDTTNDLGHLIMPDSILSPEGEAAASGSVLLPHTPVRGQMSQMSYRKQFLTRGPLILFFPLESQFGPPQESFPWTDVHDSTHCSLATRNISRQGLDFVLCSHT